jgi:aarF domain-containing kinase
VAIKVIHPGVRESIESDIHIMKFIAWILEKLPGAENLSISENVDEFSKLMTRQIDFTEEAANLERFQANFSSDRHRAPVVFPTPMKGLVSREVLVETFLAGDLMSDLLETRGALDKNTKKRLAEIGIDVVLRMTFLHNFIHGDMHPGNIK